MPAEWQARQLLLAVSEPGALGNVRSLSGRSTLSDCSTNLPSACPRNGVKAKQANRTISGRLRTMYSSSGDGDTDLLDDVAHESAWIPVRRVGLRLAGRIGAAHHQGTVSALGRVEADLPFAEAVLAFVLAELRSAPILAAVDREIHLRYARVPSERDTAGKRRDAGAQRVAWPDVRDKGPGNHAIDGHHANAGVLWFDVRVRGVGDGVGGLGPEVGIGLIEHFDVIEHLDPVGRVPARHHEAERESVEQRKRLPVHRIGEHDFVVASMVD